MSRSSRFHEIRQLVSGNGGLTAEEVRYLKILVSDVHTDLIGELPPEIVVTIALELPLDAFARCLRVSKVWRQCFLLDPVMRAYARSRWPAMIHVDRSGFQKTLSGLGWARWACRRNTGKEIVRYDKATCYALDPIFHKESSNVPDAYKQNSYKFGTDDFRSEIKVRYASGKVAWHLSDCMVVMDDLRSKTRKILTPPSGTMHGSALKLQSLGSRLAIGTINRLLVAWDHVDNQAYEKLMPSGICRCNTRDNRVAIVLYGGDVLIWSPGNTAIQLDTAHLTDGLSADQVTKWKASLNVFFDPRNENNLFLASSYPFSNPEPTIRVTVHEFSWTIRVASWSFDRNDDYSYPTYSNWALTIAMSEFEVDYSYIVFGRRQSRGDEVRMIAFDKIKRKFVDLDNFRGNSLFDWIFKGGPGEYAGGRTIKHGIDQEFKCGFGETQYSVTRINLLELP